MDLNLFPEGIPLSREEAIRLARKFCSSWSNGSRFTDAEIMGIVNKAFDKYEENVQLCRDGKFYNGASPLEEIARRITLEC